MLPKETREKVEALIEQLIAILDDIDGDADREDEPIEDTNQPLHLKVGTLRSVRRVRRQ